MNNDVVSRIKELMSYYSINALSLSKKLGYNSSEKISRLFREGGAKPSYDIIYDISNKFEINIDWLVTGRGSMLHDDGNLNSELNLISPSESKRTIKAESKDKNTQVSNKTKDKLGYRTTSLIMSDDKPHFLNLPEVGAVPFYDLPVSAGSLGVLNEWENCEPNGFVKLEAFRGCEGVFPVVGISMEPIVHSGDLIGIKSIDGLSHNWNFLQTGVIYLIVTYEDRMIKYIEEAADDDYIICSSPNYKSFRVHKADILELYRVKAVVKGL